MGGGDRHRRSRAGTGPSAPAGPAGLAVEFVAIRFARYRLPDVLREIPGVRYGAAAQSVQRFAKSLETDPEKSRFVKQLRRQLWNKQIRPRCCFKG